MESKKDSREMRSSDNILAFKNQKNINRQGCHPYTPNLHNKRHEFWLLKSKLAYLILQYEEMVCVDSACGGRVCFYQGYG